MRTPRPSSAHKPQSAAPLHGITLLFALIYRRRVIQSHPATPDTSPEVFAPAAAPAPVNLLPSASKAASLAAINMQSAASSNQLVGLRTMCDEVAGILPLSTVALGRTSTFDVPAKKLVARPAVLTGQAITDLAAMHKCFASLRTPRKV